ncbi:hypothetical protein [Legionella gresilensis]|nr:hypothetical protein [Legionella gresilensis]
MDIVPYQANEASLISVYFLKRYNLAVGEFGERHKWIKMALL